MSDLDWASRVGNEKSEPYAGDHWRAGPSFALLGHGPEPEI